MATAWFRLLTFIALAIAPLGMPAMAEAAPSADHHEMMTSQGHCDQQPQPERDHKAIDKNCCIAMCLAVVVPKVAPEFVQYRVPRQLPGSDLDRRGFLGEIATPPPKLA